jgi:hypothetical protein
MLDDRADTTDKYDDEAWGERVFLEARLNMVTA